MLKTGEDPTQRGFSSDGFVLSVLELLPAAILAPALVLSLEDRQVLAYLITRSMKTIPNISSIPTQNPEKKSSKKGPKSTSASTHQPQIFDCDCFDCYRSYWFKWDSSPNREPIHQAIEAFEDHLANDEKTKKNSGRGKRRDKLSRREARNRSMLLPKILSFWKRMLKFHMSLPLKALLLVGSNEKADGVEENDVAMIALFKRQFLIFNIFFFTHGI
ncbi:hypothetical protein CerSpe_080100 [Prunus speciosa]